jgi:hypothetical protein
MSEREAETDDDPRKQQTGQGYQEEQPSGASPKEGGGDGPDSGTGGAEEKSVDTHAGQDSSPSNATGNPGAAGG